ncbi:NAD(P)H-hydrate dehydratase [candidate division KSB1 bacterium]
MMKILPIEQVRLADAYTIKNEPIADIDLMERAAGECYKWIIDHLDSNKKVKIFCGLGNNGGDGLVIARLLAQNGFHVEVYMMRFSDKISESCDINLKRVNDINEIKVYDLFEKDPLPALGDNDIIIDALFGSGLARTVEGFIAKIIDHINDNSAVVIAIDVPSGLFCDESNMNQKGSIIKADYTLTFKPPKLAFMFPENDPYVGNWQFLDIGLMKEFIDSVESDHYLTGQNDILPLLKKRNRFSHKGQFGHGLLISGSYGKMGACILGVKAGLRSGIGLLTAHVPKCGYTIIQSSVPESMVSIDENETHFSSLPDISNYNAIAIGPGIGMHEESQNSLKLLIQNTRLPIIFDADAINILADNKTWLPFIPPACIFTPHPKEFERLIGKSSNNFERNKMQLEFSLKYKCYVVLKGAFTAITCPDGKTWFNPTGNAGMATAGSGDVLTGIILGLIAQGYSSKEACILGVYIHGLAGDMAANEKGQLSMVAGDIINNLGKAILSLSKS